MKKLFFCVLFVSLLCVPAYAEPPTNTLNETKLVWDASPSEGVEGYRFYIDTKDKQCPHPDDCPIEINYKVGLDQELVLNNMKPGETYYFTVTAYNAFGESAYSDSVSKTMPSYGDTIVEVPLPPLDKAFPNDVNIFLRFGEKDVE